MREAQARVSNLLEEWERGGKQGLCPIPDEPLPPIGTLGFRVQRYGMLQWGENRVLVTEDKDFGELVFLQGLPHTGIVRLVDMTPSERADVMRLLLENHADAMRGGAVIVVTRDRIRIRRPRNSEFDDN